MIAAFARAEGHLALQRPIIGTTIDRAKEETSLTAKTQRRTQKS
jgi:hypothetical protein